MTGESMTSPYKGIFDFTVARPYEIATPLPPADGFAGTPAMQAIESGLGAYLLAQGYERVHPQFYQDKRGDPFVYVAFDISDDGLSYIERTFVYAAEYGQWVTRILDEFCAYGPCEDPSPYTSQEALFGNPFLVSPHRVVRV